jgi:hypothetical protein
MPHDNDEQDLRDVMAEEKSRGKRPIHSEAQRERRELLKGFRDALHARTEREFLEILTELGLAGDPEKREKALKIWRSASR